jgi:site-specific recombinase XerD
MKPTDFSYHLTNYLSRYLPGLRNVSPNTIKSYRDTFSLFLRYCRDIKKIPSEKFCLSHLKKPLAEDFLNWIEQERGCSISTRNQRLAAIHAFCKYLQYECPASMMTFQEILSVPIKKNHSSAFEYITLEGIRIILEQPDRKTNNGIRDLTLLALMYDTGARVQEVADICLCDVRLTSPATIKLNGKGRKSRIVPLMSRTLAILEKYFEKFNLIASSTATNPLFSNRSHEKLTRSGISHILAKYVELARNGNGEHIPKKVSPHTLRHSRAMHLLQSGVNLIYIRDLLGHTNIKTTEIYARADADMKRTALENASRPIIQHESSQWQENNDLLKWLQNLGVDSN